LANESTGEEAMVQIELTNRESSLLIELIEQACWSLVGESYEARTLREHVDLQAKSLLAHEILDKIRAEIDNGGSQDALQIDDADYAHITDVGALERPN
jgi:hypothetical protein